MAGVSIEVEVRCPICEDQMANDHEMVKMDKHGTIIVSPQVCKTCLEEIREEGREEGREEVSELEEEIAKLKAQIVALEISQRYVVSAKREGNK